VTGEQGAAFARVALDPEQKIQDFLAELAKLRNLVIADTPGGDLWFRKSVSTGSPVAKLKGQPLVSVKAQFNPQDYFSEITGIAKATRKKKGGKYTVKNDHISGVLRPFTFKPDDLERADIPGAARSKFGRMFGNMVSYTATLPTWRDPDGVLFEPNTTIKITAPDAMIYRETEFLIREVTLKQTADSKTAELGLSLPGAFSGEAPSVFPWE
jgi:prophage tail gpP-like protein